MMLKGSYMFDKFSVALPYKKGDVKQNGSSGQWNQSLFMVLLL